jgi:hypothetical protein
MDELLYFLFIFPFPTGPKRNPVILWGLYESRFQINDGLTYKTQPA